MISIENEQNKVEVPESLLSAIKNTIEYTLNDQKVQYEPEIGVLLVDNETIREINQEHREKDQVTDVLSFPMIEYEEGLTYVDLYTDYEFGPEYFEEDALLLGDMVLSMEKAMEQAEEFGHSLKREVCYLTVHSILHLLGYDHMLPEDQRKMREAEERILTALDIPRE